MSNQAKAIKKYILEKIEEYPSSITRKACEKFSVSSTTIRRHLQALESKNLVGKSGNTKSCHYFLKSKFTKELVFKLDNNLSEFEIWEKYFSSYMENYPSNVENICHYGFTEILNNVIDHSKAINVKIKSILEKESLCFEITDDGIGVFENISSYFHYEDLRESIVQLSLGKCTTNPNEHTGEGIFFSSRAFDRFEIIANGYIYIRDNVENDWTFKSFEKKNVKGTQIKMRLSEKSKKNLVDIFKAYQNEETLAFEKTVAHVKLSQFGGETFVSRSQAKRFIQNLERFRKIDFDFTGVTFVGQGFVDEIFRVYQNKHPQMQLVYSNASPDVEFMIKRTLAMR